MGNNSGTRYFPPEKVKDWKAYCVLDVGDISCGYAYTFNNTKNIWFNKNWAETQGYLSLRTPSAVLYKNKEANEFGFSAINKYRLHNDDPSWEFSYDGLLKPNSRESIYKEFEDFAMKEVKQETTQFLQGAIYGRIPEGFKTKIDLAVLLRKHFDEEIKQTYSDKQPAKIDWIFLVPYQWDVKVKTVFKQILKTHFCEKITSLRHHEATVTLVNTADAMGLTAFSLHQTEFVSFGKKPKSSIIVVDSGGTSTEISLHRTKPKSKLITLDQTFTYQGGSMVNINLENELNAYVEDFVNKCRSDHLPVWLEFVMQFEIARRNAQYKGNGKGGLNVNISLGFSEAFKSITGKTLKEAFKGDITLTEGGMLSITEDLVTKIFTKMNVIDESEINDSVIDESVINKSVIDERQLEKLETWLTKQGSSDEIKQIILTGGFGSSVYFRQVIEERFRNKNISFKTPEAADMFQAKGALIQSKTASHPPYDYAISFYEEATSDDLYQEDIDEGEPGKRYINKMIPFISKKNVLSVGSVYEFGKLDLPLCKNELALLKIDDRFSQLKGLSVSVKGKCNTRAHSVVSLDSWPIKKQKRIDITIFFDVNHFEVKLKETDANTEVPSKVTTNKYYYWGNGSPNNT